MKGEKVEDNKTENPESPKDVPGGISFRCEINILPFSAGGRMASISGEFEQDVPWPHAPSAAGEHNRTNDIGKQAAFIPRTTAAAG